MLYVYTTVRYFKHIVSFLSFWLRHYATSRKVAGSIPDEVTEFFN
jgi:hypothetical protein